MKIISFYTDDWEYPQHAKRMRADCSKLGLDVYVAEQESRQDYIRNTAIKPFFIKDCLEKFKIPVLWVDVDGLLLKRPERLLPWPKVDFAAVKHFTAYQGREWAVGLMWFNYTPQALALVDAWCAAAVTGTDEAAFDIAWKSMRQSVTALELPAEYHYVRWRTTVPIPTNTVFCNQLSKSPDKMRRKFNGQVIEND